MYSYNCNIMAIWQIVPTLASKDSFLGVNQAISIPWVSARIAQVIGSALQCRSHFVIVCNT